MLTQALCEMCLSGFRFAGRIFYIVPSSRGELLPFSCRNCGARYKHAATMTRHRRKCEGRYNITCSECGKSFYRHDNYKVHLHRSHGIVHVPPRGKD